MDNLAELFRSPIGAPLLLFIGALVQLIIGRWLRQSSLLTGVALLFVIIAALQVVSLRTQSIVPVFSQPWQPLLQRGTNLVWIGDGWNWYMSCLILLLGGVGILLNWQDTAQTDPQESSNHLSMHIGSNLAVHLSILASALLFVGSGNILTVILTWVVMDILILIRSAVSPAELMEPTPTPEQGTKSQRRINLSSVDGTGQLLKDSRFNGFSLLGAMLLLIGLLPAGPEGPSQPLQGGTLPFETVYVMLIAGAIRAGAYPFHLWLFPIDNDGGNLPDRLLNHLIPVLCGLWLLGWTVDLGGEFIFLRPEITALVLLAMLGSAISAWTAADQPNHTSFVLITSAGLAGLVGTLAYENGPSALIWPTTTFALGGGLWLVGERVWQEWGWQIPVSIGALALAGVPFTPGFLTQPALARLFTDGDTFILLFLLYIIAQTFQIAALLRSWGAERSEVQVLTPGATIRKLIACLVLVLALGVIGFFPRATAELINLPNAIPPTLGNPPSVVADVPVWVTLILPLLLGISLTLARPRIMIYFGGWSNQLSRLTRLEWLFQASWWGVNRMSQTWENAISVLEGTGYMGWLIVFIMAGYLLLRA